MPDTPPQQPPPTPPTPAKPIKTTKWVLIATTAVVICGFLVAVLNSVRLATAPPTATRPQVTDPAALAAFRGGNSSQVDKLNNGPQKEDDEAPSVTPPTKEQKTALGISGKSDAQQKREEREKRRLAALRSSSVMVDFSAEEEKGDKLAASTSRRETETHPPPPAEPDDKEPTIPDEKKPLASWDAYTGKLYRLFEGRDMIEAILMNRINGSAAGPIMAQVSLDIYSHNHQKLLIPQGTVLTGQVTAVNSTQQQRLFAAFHRMVMPDGFSVSLDKFTGLDQAGEVGLRDLVNHHYLSIFGASLAIGAIGGLSQIGNSTSGFGYDPGVEFRNGVSQRTGEEAMQVLNRFLNQLPTFTVRERSRLRIWLSNDLLLPAADNHTMPGDI